MELTEPQKEFLRAVNKLTKVAGYPPTYAEIKEYMGYASVNAVQSFVDRLIKKGAMTKDYGKSRTLKVWADVRQRRG